MILSRNDKQVTEEVFSSTMHSALKSVPGLRNRKNIFGWFMKIAKNRFYDYLRSLYHTKNIVKRMERNLQTTAANPLTDPVDIIAENYKFIVLKLALQNVKVEYRRIIELKYFKELTYKQIADRIRISRDAAESLLYRAVAALKKEVRKLGYFF